MERNHDTLMESCEGNERLQNMISDQILKSTESILTVCVEQIKRKVCDFLVITFLDM